MDPSLKIVTWNYTIKLNNYIIFELLHESFYVDISIVFNIFREMEFSVESSLLNLFTMNSLMSKYWRIVKARFTAVTNHSSLYGYACVQLCFIYRNGFFRKFVDFVPWRILDVCDISTGHQTMKYKTSTEHASVHSSRLIVFTIS